MASKRNKKKSNVRTLIANNNPRSPISEQYRTIRTNLQFSSVDETLQAIMVTSSGPDEGKSMTTANLAVVYAQQGKKVLLIDGDLRKPTVHYTFRLDNLNGLSNVLVGDNQLTEAIITSDVENLDVMTSGPIPPNPSELLGSNKMQKLLDEARQMYDVILFDTPPLLAVTDAQLLAGLCDGSILIVRSNVTENDGAEKSVELLQHANAKLLGTVLNDHSKKDTNYYYYYGK
ncbi:CpsD/CapB family tyrosine-protein kinase [Virgibacillus siamensis]|uniref:CpsD/CapB family tyrosine-protein kinase n=1 Tax=Virgibacillus siamensis TaxID=480071 RepID=UPI0009853807|nr:CpsD/CapB family tyrosine-protein kinase [Virgibacillus siamensis]